MNNVPPSATGKMNFIQVLRGISALGVVLFHIQDYTLNLGGTISSPQFYIPDFFGETTRLFFAISGFVMTWLICEKPAKNFLFHRFLRIYPAYWTAVVLAVFSYTVFLGSYVVSPRDFFQTLTLLPIGQEQFALRVEWTLVFEIFFYIICSLFTHPWLKKIYPFFLVIWIGLIMAGNEAVKNAVPNGLDILLDPRNLAFLFGGLAYYLTRLNIRFNGKQAILVFGSLAGAYILGYYIHDGAIRKTLLLHTVSGESVRALFMGLFVYAAIYIPFNPQSFWVRFGDYSYGVYLTHAPIIYITYMLFLKSGLSLNGLPAIIALTIALWVGWQFGRFDVWLHQWLKNQHIIFTPQLKAFVIFVVLAVFGLHYAPYLKTLTASKEISEPSFSSLNPALVITDTPGGGVVDAINQSNQFLVAQGWAVDRELNTPVQSIIMTANEQILSIEVVRIIRQDVAQYLGSSILNPDFGWQIKSDLSSLPPASYLINIYAQTEQGKYHLINAKPYTIIIKTDDVIIFIP